ncbi:bile acid:sodium symporter [Nocardia otitidiscaviarum]|uniref:bile acid:sodium symporter family protein n=1 Tax=Nocardia otitidiscaviarum TaxID=1823 RepID=UPI0004A70F61|nr:bile acid:sodium symporter family protein [Nocardia otitidiscaviarum]MBF6137129.1 bile acid:sodium symporter [Nocardia otitidiscaviarum]MBF6237733.1 bile acid:sodium symporter [Nocardia otitidiscaviarum]MBF6488028.1 bile acid:sodium symporter [Nocardia otitidiscaviarum]
MRFLSKFYIDGFILSILAVVVLASVFPARGDGAEVVGWLTKIAIALLFLLYGARLHPREALAGLTHWRLHLTVLACTFVLFPLLGLASHVLVPTVLTEDLYTGLLFLTLVPSTVQSSIAFTSIARGNVAGAIVSATLSNLLGVFLTPALVILLMNTTGQAEVDPGAIVDIVLQLLVPFIAGQLLRPKISGWMVRHAESTKLVDRGSILLVVYSAFSAGMVEGIWQSMSPWRIVGLTAVCCVLLAIVLAATAFVGDLAKFDRADRIVVVFCGSKKSLATGLPMATVLFAGAPVGLIVLPLMIFHQVQLITCAALAQRWARTAD